MTTPTAWVDRGLHLSPRDALDWMTALVAYVEKDPTASFSARDVKGLVAIAEAALAVLDEEVDAPVQRMAWGESTVPSAKIDALRAAFDAWGKP